MSIPWLTGGRLAPRVVERHVAAALIGGRDDAVMMRAATACERAWRQAGETLGPASGAGAVWEHVVRPCAAALGWSLGEVDDDVLAGAPAKRATGRFGHERHCLLALPWGASQDGLHRAAVRAAARESAQWASVCNGESWRWYDVARPFTRDHVGVDLTQATADARVWHALWILGGAGGRDRRAPAGAASSMDRLLAASAMDEAVTARGLRDGVALALEGLGRHLPTARDAHVTLVFQWLFLLLGEARGLLPAWHPAYGRAYALSALAADASRPRPRMGVHESLVAIERGGREGVSLGSVGVRALNGPLFATMALARSRRLPDATLAAILRRVTHAGDGAIDFSALGVEHLGSIYEHLMSPGGAPALARKHAGAFYTPRSLADFLVQRTLEPLVRDASAAQILALRILDPAMGSGALLASALRYLTGAVEAAWVREGRAGPLDVDARERASLPRRIVEQCLFGADIDPRAVQVARLSLWLSSLAPDRPLTWLDGHLLTGNSLIGASPALLLARMPSRRASRMRKSDRQLPLFDLERWHHEAGEVGPLLEALAARPTESARDAHDKSLALEAIRARQDLATWRARASAWCGAAMDGHGISDALWRSVDDRIRRGGVASETLAERACGQRWAQAAASQHCLHWALEFPDVFDAGRGGFDAVVANPPWEMLRADLGTGDQRKAHRRDVAPLLRFVNRSGLYRQVSGHVNSYQLFLERMLQLVRPGGRIGCLMPGGMLADHGASALRRHVLDHAAVDRVSILSNRDAHFPIHRSLRIVCTTATAGAATDGILVDDGPIWRASGRQGVVDDTARWLPRALLRRATGEAEAIPSLRGAREIAVLDTIMAAPRLGGEDWRLRFGRELNATEDRARFRTRPGADDLVVIDGKHLGPFAVRVPQDGPWIPEAEAAAVLPGAPWRSWRLAYRDVSSPANSRSLIAGIVPPGCVSTHTVFCVRAPPPLATQLYLCGMLSSLVADWFVRRFLSAHVTTRLIACVPVPRVPRTDPRRRQVVRLALRLMRAPDDESAQAELHLAAAALYGIDREAMQVVASDFAHLTAGVRAAIAAWRVGAPTARATARS